MDPKSIKQSIRDHAVDIHSRTPGIRQLPLPAVAIIVGLGLLNALAWAGVGIALVGHDDSTLTGDEVDGGSTLTGTRSTERKDIYSTLLIIRYCSSEH